MLDWTETVNWTETMTADHFLQRFVFLQHFCFCRQRGSSISFLLFLIILVALILVWRCLRPRSRRRWVSPHRGARPPEDGITALARDSVQTSSRSKIILCTRILKLLNFSCPRPCQVICDRWCSRFPFVCVYTGKDLCTGTQKVPRWLPFFKIFFRIARAFSVLSCVVV